MYQAGFIGCGNMGSALARAAAKVMEPKNILLANATRAKAEALAKEIGAFVGTNREVAESCTYIFLGVKPQKMAEVLEELQPVFARRNMVQDSHFILVTMAAGISIRELQGMAGFAYPVIRIMPNTPVSIGKGMTLACASEEVTKPEYEEFERLLSASGRVDLLSESQIDAGGALSGCGPAYAYLFLEALSDGAVACGLPRAKAIEYAAQTLLGAASLVLETGRHPGELKDAVCSPGGTTIEGVHALERGGFRGLAMDAVRSAYEKTNRLKKQ